MKELIKNYNSTVISNAYELFGSFSKGNNVTFRLWAPNANKVSIVGDFNGWSYESNPMRKIDGGCWETIIDGIENFSNYKYAVTNQYCNSIFCNIQYTVFSMSFLLLHLLHLLFSSSS